MPAYRFWPSPDHKGAFYVFRTGLRPRTPWLREGARWFKTVIPLRDWPPNLSTLNRLTNIYVGRVKSDWPVQHTRPPADHSYFLVCGLRLLWDEWARIQKGYLEFIQAMPEPGSSTYQRYPPLPDGQSPRVDIQVTWMALRYALDLAYETFTCRNVLPQSAKETWMRLLKKIGAEKARNDAETRFETSLIT